MCSPQNSTTKIHYLFSQERQQRPVLIRIDSTFGFAAIRIEENVLCAKLSQFVHVTPDLVQRTLRCRSMVVGQLRRTEDHLYAWAKAGRFHTVVVGNFAQSR